MNDKIYTKENLLVLHEYRHAFKNSYLIIPPHFMIHPQVAINNLDFVIENILFAIQNPD